MWFNFFNILSSILVSLFVLDASQTVHESGTWNMLNVIITRAGIVMNEYRA